LSSSHCLRVAASAKQGRTGNKPSDGFYGHDQTRR
jgi:hypothetical protein